MNASGKLDEGNELTFSLDRRSRRPVIKIVNRSTNEIVAQIPSEEVLRLADDLKLREEPIRPLLTSMPLNSFTRRIESLAPARWSWSRFYTPALRAVQSAREHVRSGNIAARSREISKAQEIPLELAESVDASQATS